MGNKKFSRTGFSRGGWRRGPWWWWHDCGWLVGIVCVTAGFFIGSPPATAQPGAGANDREANSVPAWPAAQIVDAAAQLRYEQAETALRRIMVSGENGAVADEVVTAAHREAVHHLRALLREDSTGLIRANATEGAVNVRRGVVALLQQHPDLAAAYRAAVASEADAEFAAVASAVDPVVAAMAVWRRFPTTPAADSATVVAMRGAVSAGRWAMAMRAARTILANAEAEVPVRAEATWVCARSAANLGEWVAVEQIRSELPLELMGVPIRLPAADPADPPSALAAVLDRMLGERSPGPAADGTWPSAVTWRGRLHAASGMPDLQARLWTADHRSVAPTARVETFNIFHRPICDHVRVFPAVADGRVFVPGRFGVTAWNLFSGARLWHFEPPTEADHFYRRELDPSVMLAVTLDSAGVLVPIEQPFVRARDQLHQIFGLIEKFPFPRRALVALDPDTGAERWRLGGLDPAAVSADAPAPAAVDGLSFPHPPVRVGDLLVAVALRPHGDTIAHYVVGLRPAPARPTVAPTVEWITHVGTASRDTTLLSRLCRELAPSPLAVADGMAFVVTHFGWMAAIDISTGRLVWGRPYRRVEPRRRLDVTATIHEIAAANSAPVIAGKTVFAAPMDADALVAFDTATGQPRALPRSVAEFVPFRVVGLDDRRVLAVGFGNRRVEVVVFDARSAESPLQGAPLTAGRAAGGHRLGIGGWHDDSMMPIWLQEMYHAVHPAQQTARPARLASGNAVMVDGVFVVVHAPDTDCLQPITISAYARPETIVEKLRTRANLPGALGFAARLQLVGFETDPEAAIEHLTTIIRWTAHLDEPAVLQVRASAVRALLVRMQTLVEIAKGDGDLAHANACERAAVMADFVAEPLTAWQWRFEAAVLDNTPDRQQGLLLELLHSHPGERLPSGEAVEVFALSRLAQMADHDGLPAEAVSRWHQLRETCPNEPLDGRIAGAVAADAMTRLIDAHGPTVYADLEAQAEAAMSNAGSDTSALAAVIATFPHSLTAQRARLKIAQIVLAAAPADEPLADAARFVEMAVEFANWPADADFRAEAWMLGTELFQRAGRFTSAARLAERLAAEFAGQTVTVGDHTVEIDAFVAAVRANRPSAAFPLALLDEAHFDDPTARPLVPTGTAPLGLLDGYLILTPPRLEFRRASDGEPIWALADASMLRSAVHAAAFVDSRLVILTAQGAIGIDAATGTVAWQTEFVAPTRGATIADGLIAVMLGERRATDNQFEFWLAVFDATDGSKIGESLDRMDSIVSTAPLVHRSGGIVVIHSLPTGEVWGYRISNVARPAYKLDYRAERLTASPILADAEHIAVPAGNTIYLHRADDGLRTQKIPVEEGRIRFGGVFVATADRAIGYSTTSNTVAVADSRTGVQRWKRDFGPLREIRVTQVGAFDEMVFVMLQSQTGVRAVALDAKSGAPQWEAELADGENFHGFELLHAPTYSVISMRQLHRDPGPDGAATLRIQLLAIVVDRATGTIHQKIAPAGSRLAPQIHLVGRVLYLFTGSAIYRYGHK